MTKLFVDTSFFIALLIESDDLHEAARALAAQTLTDQRITSEPVITELLDDFGDRGAYFRRMALQFADALRDDPRIEIIPQTPELFAAGLDLYRWRPDKGYSMTDCMSMAVCDEQRIERVPTHDPHFAQEGLETLL